MLSALQTALTDPESFFDREAADPRLGAPAVVVGVLAVVSLLGSIPVLGAVAGAVPDEARPFVLVGLVVSAAVSLVVPFVVWLVYAALFYGLSALFDGEGAFRDLLAVVGWGFAPKILASVVGALVTYALVSSGDLSTPQQAQRFAQAAATSPLGLVNRGFGLLMTLWSAWLWFHAVAAVRALTRRDAAITVGVVVLLELALDVGSAALV